MKKKRVIMLVPVFPKLSETFIASKFVGLYKRGLDVHVFCFASPEKEWKYFPDLGALRKENRIHKVWLPSPRLLVLLLFPITILRCLFASPHHTLRYIQQGWVLFRWRVFWQLYQDAEILLLKPDILHYEFGALATQHMHLSKWLGFKTVVSFRGYDLNFSSLDNPNYYQDVWRRADALHLLGEDLWQRAQARGCPANKTHVLIPPAIDSSFFRPGGEKTRETRGGVGAPLRIISVGRLDWRKGYEYDLQAVKILVTQGFNCQYRILGDGEYLEAIAFARRQLGLEDVVEFLGPLPREDIRQQMQWADVFLHLAVSEGFCNAVLEAQSMQLPVICSDAGGLGQNIEDGKSGFIVPRRDALAAAEKLIHLAGAPLLRQQMGVAGRERVETEFQLEKQISAFEALYTSMYDPNN